MSAQSYCSNCDIVYPFGHGCCPLCMLKQVSGVLCDKCGWAMKFPNDDTNTEELCRCELEEQNKKLRDLLAKSLKHIGVEPYPIFEATEPVRKLKKEIKELLKGKA